MGKYAGAHIPRANRARGSSPIFNVSLLLCHAYAIYIWVKVLVVGKDEEEFPGGDEVSAMGKCLLPSIKGDEKRPIC